MVPILSSRSNLSVSKVQCIVKYTEIDSLRYLGVGFPDRPWGDSKLSIIKRIILKLNSPLGFRAIPKLEKKYDLYFKGRWGFEGFISQGPIKSLTMPQFATAKVEVVNKPEAE